MNKNLKIFLSLFLIFISFFFVFELNYYNHWSGSLEDFTQVYNGLIINSGSKAEYHDHPGHSLILFISLWLELLDMLNIIKFSNFEQLDKSNNLSEDLNNIVAHAKMINVIFLLTFLIFIYKYLKLLSKDKILIYLFLIIITTSWPLLHVIDMLKSEFLSAVTIYISFYFIAASVNKNNFNRKYVFLSGFFFMLSIFAKFHSIFIYIFLPLSLLLFKKKTINIEFNKFEKKTNLIILNFIFFIGIILIYLKYVQGLNYFFIPMGIIYFLILAYFLNKFFFKNKNFSNIFFSYFLIGSITCFFILVILKPFHTNNINVIVNGFGQANMFIQGMSPYSSEIDIVLNLTISAFKGFLNIIKVYFYNLSMLTLSMILILLSVPMNLLINNYKNTIVASVTILIVVTICFLFAVRPSLHYLIFLTPLIFCSTFYLVMNLKNKNYLYFFIVFIIIANSFNVYEIIQDHKFQTLYKYACKQDINNPNSYMRWWHKQIDQDFVNRACN